MRYPYPFSFLKRSLGWGVVALSLILAASVADAWAVTDKDKAQVKSDKPVANSKTIQGTIRMQNWTEAEQSVIGNGDTTLIHAFPDQDWWQKFEDPYLSGYIEEALRSSPTLNAAMTRIDQSRALVMQATSRQLPSLGLNPNFTRIKIPSNVLGGGGFLPGSVQLYQLPIQASYELDLFGKNRDMTRSAKKQVDASIEAAKSTRIALSGEVASAYFNLVRSDALLKTQEENLALLTRISALKVNQNKLGLVSFDETIRADRDVAEAQTELTLYKEQQALFAHQLAVLMGRPPVARTDMQRQNVQAISLPKETETGLPAELVSRRPDVLAQERQLERASIDVQVARKSFFPTINLSSSFGFLSGRIQDAFDWGSRTDQQGIKLGQPLFRGGDLAGNLKLKKAQQREQIENYRQVILVAFKEVEDSLSTLRAQYESLDSNTKRLELTQHQLKLTENLSNQGLVPHVNVLQGQSEVTRYQQLRIKSKMDAAVATVNLFKALGGGF